MKLVHKNITIEESQDKWLENNNKKLSPMVQKMLNKEMKNAKH